MMTVEKDQVKVESEKIDMNKDKDECIKEVSVNSPRKKIDEAMGWYIAGSIILVIGIIYFILYKIIGFSVNFSPAPCAFAHITHLYCPGCGGTRAVKALMDFHWIKSALYNPIVIYGVLMCGYYYIGETITLLKGNKKKYTPFKDWTLWMVLVVILGNFVIRNLLLVFAHVDYIGDLLSYWTR